jgi:hypothetical protein
LLPSVLKAVEKDDEELKEIALQVRIPMHNERIALKTPFVDA